MRLDILASWTSINPNKDFSLILPCLPWFVLAISWHEVREIYFLHKIWSFLYLNYYRLPSSCYNLLCWLLAWPPSNVDPVWSSQHVASVETSSRCLEFPPRVILQLGLVQPWEPSMGLQVPRLLVIRNC